jgi:hypothetical protein
VRGDQRLQVGRRHLGSEFGAAMAGRPRPLHGGQRRFPGSRVSTVSTVSTVSKGRKGKGKGNGTPSGRPWRVCNGQTKRADHGEGRSSHCVNSVNSVTEGKRGGAVARGRGWRGSGQPAAYQGGAKDGYKLLIINNVYGLFFCIYRSRLCLWLGPWWKAPLATRPARRRGPAGAECVGLFALRCGGALAFRPGGCSP